MMATRHRTIKVEKENGVQEKAKKILQITKNPTAGLTKRAALGELGNRAVSKASEVQKENPSIKNVKPRVDSYRKKAEVVSNGSNKVTAAVKTQKAPTVVAKNSNEIKVLKTKVVGRPKADEKQGAQKIQTFQDIIVPVRREESNVSRRSLSKLKAVLCKEKKEKPKAVITAQQSQPAAAPVLVQVKLKDAEILSHSSSLLEEACVENIDAGDSKNPLLVSDYANDIYSYLFQLEKSLSVRKGHLDKQTEVNPKMRAVLLDWINEVSFQFKLLPETYHLTVSIIDRYLQQVHTTQRQYLQLVGVGALFLASKYEELYPPEIGDFVYIADDSYTKQQILSIEQRIIRNIDFDLGRPSSMHFLRRFSKAASTAEENHMLAKYFLELATIEYTLAHHRPSEVAAASLLLSLKLLNKDRNATDDHLWTNTLKFYTTYTVDYLRPLVKKLATLVKNAPTAQLKAVYNKYQSSKFDKIALKSELHGPLLDKIISDSECSCD